MIVSVDPTGKYEGVSKGKLVDACGLIPIFAVDAFVQRKDTAQAFYDVMVESYGFGDWSSAGWGTVGPEGVLKSDQGDPDMSPLLELSFPESGIKVYVYQSAIMAVVGPDETIVSRMD